MDEMAIKSFETPRKFKFKRYIIYYFFALFLIISTPLSFMGVFNRSTTQLLEMIGYTMIAVISLSLVVGFLGELSLGHAGFMSIGAILGMYIQQTLFKGIASSAPLLSLILTMIVGGIIAAFFGFLIGLPALRLKGDYLAIVTLAFGEIVKIIIQNIPALGGAIGLSNEFRYNSKRLFLIIILVAFLVLVLVKNLLKSKFGRNIMSIRDNEIASRAMGINVTFYKLMVFVLSAFLAGVAGVLYGASNYNISSSTFGYNYSINNILVMVVIGGMGNINGSVISAIVVTFIDVKLGTSLSGNMALIKPIIFALILILIVIYNNAPGLKNFREKYNLHNLYIFIKRKIKKLIFKTDELKVDPSIQKDFGADWSKIPTKIEMNTIVTTDLKVDVDPTKPDKGGKKHE